MKSQRRRPALQHRAKKARRRPANRFHARTRPSPTPRKSNRFLPETTPIPTPRPITHISSYPESQRNPVRRHEGTITRRVIIPLADYYDFSPSNYEYQIGSSHYPLVDSVPATPLFTPNPQNDISHLYGPLPVNYGYEVNHF